jgi:hypothetical protein
MENVPSLLRMDPDRGPTVYNYEGVDIRGELPGLSVFLHDNDLILHSYSTYGASFSAFSMTDFERVRLSLDDGNSRR